MMAFDFHFQLIIDCVGSTMRPWLDGNDVENVFFASLWLKTLGGFLLALLGV